MATEYSSNTEMYAGLTYSNSLSRYLIDTNGQPFVPNKNLPSNNWTSFMTYDLVVSGTYELDPTSWFV
jgi:hypothetical protein